MAPTASKKRTSHSMSVKHAAITEVDKGAKKANVAAKYGITRWLLGDWIRNRVDIFKAVHSGGVDAKSSDGWLTRHKSRNDIVSRKLVGEGNTNSVNTDVVDTFRADVASDLVARYPVEDIDNTDEAGLNYHAVYN